LIGIPQHHSSADGFVCHRTHLNECMSISDKATSMPRVYCECPSVEAESG
jgi:hypothetical protein